MITTHLDTWLGLLEDTCTQAGTGHLDIIVDQAGSEAPLLPSVLSVEPALAWHSLFSGLPEASAEALAPLLIRVELGQPLQRRWLMGLMAHLDSSSQLLALVSTWPFEALAEHLGQCQEVRNGGCLGLLRFYDPRLFPLLFSHVLQPEQHQPWLHPAVCWSWLDRDGLPRQLPGAPGAPDRLDSFVPIELNDDQLDTLCCASDATLAMVRLKADFPSAWGAERRFQSCYAAMLDASKSGLLLVTERKACILDKVRSAGMATANNHGKRTL